jgi:hypothetical protein
MKIDFEFDTPYGKFSDALWFDDNQPAPDETQIEILKQQRLNNWLTIFTADPEPADMTEQVDG